MRYSTIEIRWHDTLPMYSVDAQPFECETHKRKINPYQKTAENISDGDGKLWRLATAGGDKKVRIWLAIPSPTLHPNANGTGGAGAASGSATAGPSKASINASSSSSGATAGKPKVEYMATLDKHTLTVNVVRFSPAGHLLATAGDDAGTAGIFIWRLSTNAPSASFGSRSDDAAYERESWQAIKMIKTKSPEIYDLVWSPDGEYILTGGTDAAARVYRVSDGMCVAELTDHKDWVQGVAWDPLNRYIATQGKDRAMHVYSIDTSSSTDFKVKLVSKNSRLTTETVHPSSTTSLSRSGSPSISTSTSSALENGNKSTSTPSTSTLTPTTQPQQQKITTHSHAMYGDEESSPFFRRLAFATDGSLLLTPAGLMESSSSSSSSNSKKSKKTPLTTIENGTSTPSTSSDKKISLNNGKDSTMKQKKLPSTSSMHVPTVYMFARGQWENNEESPVACLSGHRTTSIAVRFNPVLWDLRDKKGNSSSVEQDKGKGKEKETVDGDGELGMEIDGTAAESITEEAANGKNGHSSSSTTNETKDTEAPSTTIAPKGIFNLKQRSIYAVATHETILIYDTQQSLPICMFGSLHFAAFTDLTWTGDGLTLIATSSDGYASIFTFEEGELGTPSLEQQPRRSASRYEEGLLANSANSVSTSANGSSLLSSPVKQVQAAEGPIVIGSSPAQPSAQKRENGEVIMLDGDSQEDGTKKEEGEQPKKVKKRAALTFVSTLGGGA